ncbi:type II toxin-antitoxin system antitoxin, RelB/DinJ family [Sedimentibacter hydroxybenzoicus DSM 7310]|uniref:Type II toxin-antitoxin system antitoxin, RelB/DinJ family n=1 Tax=Sedimentibacter hydroxybenzoicus DSM 7310 TaxID=1123245 RepID=A0A974BIY9_SEDHY|nr:type II toxin-antitoxin system antitoxin, RelB/DinJ family [Sedimentibacter hydroxybenzoicus DSM 7310]
MCYCLLFYLICVLLQRGIPFEVKLPESVPLSYDSLAKEQFDIEIEKGIKDIENGKTYSIESIAEEMKRDYGI